jgi:hypothetical protein
LLGVQPASTWFPAQDIEPLTAGFSLAPLAPGTKPSGPIADPLCWRRCLRGLPLRAWRRRPVVRDDPSRKVAAYWIQCRIFPPPCRQAWLTFHIITSHVVSRSAVRICICACVCVCVCVYTNIPTYIRTKTPMARMGARSAEKQGLMFVLDKRAAQNVWP